MNFVLLSLGLAWSFLPPSAAHDVRGGAPADSIEVYYGRGDIRALKAYCDRRLGIEAGDSRLQCLYRLFPMTRDEALLEDLQTDLLKPSARGLALLSGLWGYRASTAGLINAVRHGRRAQQLLDRAIEIDPDDPFVMLVDAHSLLFKPRIAGGDRRKAALRFGELAARMDASMTPAIAPEEALTWQWYALRLEDDPHADAVRARLEEHRVPALFRNILDAPLGP